MQSLVKELRSHMLHGMIKKIKKRAEKVNSAGSVLYVYIFMKKKKKAKICLKFFFDTFKDRKINYTSELLFSH